MLSEYVNTVQHGVLSYSCRVTRMKIKPKELRQITDFEGMPKPKVARGHTQKKAVQVHKNKRAYNRKRENLPE